MRNVGEYIDHLQARSHSVRSAAVHKALRPALQTCSPSTGGAQGPEDEAIYSPTVAKQQHFCLRYAHYEEVNSVSFWYIVK